MILNLRVDKQNNIITLLSYEGNLNFTNYQPMSRPQIMHLPNTYIQNCDF